MAEPSLLCVNCARPPPPHRRTWGRCTVCVARNLPSTYYCGEECMNAHWPKHKVYHTEQKQKAKEWREGASQRARSLAEVEARRAEETGGEYQKRGAAALALAAEGDHNAAAKAWRRIIKEWPDGPAGYHNLAVELTRSCRDDEAAPMYVKAMELEEDGTEHWAVSVAQAFDLLKHPVCDEVPKPEWWNDEALKALSARVVAVAPDGHQECAMRARVLMGHALGKAPWNAEPRTAAEIKEAAKWWRRCARVALLPAEKTRCEDFASECDAFADPLLAEEEAEAAKARAAADVEAEKALKVADVEAAEALKVAEAKAAAAAEELLAEDAKEKQQAIMESKAKQGKGKNGKGKR